MENKIMLMLQNGKKEGKATLYYSNGNREEFTYVNGIDTLEKGKK